MAGLLFSLLLFGSSFLVAFIYPNVGNDVLHFTFWGIIIVACVQPAKVLNSILGNGILPSGGDTKYVLLAHAAGSYGLGVPVAILSGFILRLSVWGIFDQELWRRCLRQFSSSCATKHQPGIRNQSRNYDLPLPN